MELQVHLPKVKQIDSASLRMEETKRNGSPGCVHRLETKRARLKQQLGREKDAEVKMVAWRSSVMRRRAKNKGKWTDGGPRKNPTD